MNIIIFILVLGILVFIHELGHFLFAKMFGIRVDEFGFGYPPKAFTIGNFKGTDITLNWIPFGGFVKIFGESDDGSELTEEQKKVSLIHKPRWQQFLVMFGGVLFNIVFAWILLSGIYMSGINAPVGSAPSGYDFNETELIVSSVNQNSPAEAGGLLPGDIIVEFFSDDTQVSVSDETIEDFSNFINEQYPEDENIGLVVLRDESLEIINLTPEEGIIEGKYAVGVSAERMGELKLSFFNAFYYGALNTIGFIKNIAIGFWDLITGSISADNVSGPVGIVKQVGDASKVGFQYLIGFTAILSLNLAVLNLVPFPALDGGRILIIFVESILRRRLNPKVINAINGIGFIVLIGLMLLVTFNDITKLL
ncbi:RIP metalloprotease RseP [Candidatus Campbellbacteria bacterium]|nr:RIP metalloprotease RseP [Candidatus Campbellbacteria bacterium]|tara:strand:+ start:3286 stop:4383 length:1098 start_codon:yes stop_codon:yes gene_type:complete